MSQNYFGSSLNDIYKEQGPWNFFVPRISPSKSHTVLYCYPLVPNELPKPYKSKNPKHWDEDHVRMPYSLNNVHVAKQNGTEYLKSRWSTICENLKKPINNVEDFEAALGSYHNNFPKKLDVLHNFFKEVFIEEESNEFFKTLLPRIIELALSLPDLLPNGIPLLKSHLNHAVSMTQLQVASLMANAFLCTFPTRKETALSYPRINFIDLYTSSHRPKRQNCVMEKLKALIHYFRRVTSKTPKGVITYERIFVPRNKIPRWDVNESNMGNVRVHLTSNGTIEDDGIGCLQIDFANKKIGGGVLGYGCVQEEIRFVICPELIISRLFTEVLTETEAVVITGIERYSQYSGYSDAFQWEGNFDDKTPYDEFSRRRTSVAAIDAVRFDKGATQYNSSCILRELNKAYVGFFSHETRNLAPIATGNWGCGAFNGNPQLKSLIQLIACSATNRDLIYFSFGNKELVEDFYKMYLFIATNGIRIKEIWRILCKFDAKKLQPDNLYAFIQQCYYDSKNNLNQIGILPKPNDSVPSTSGAQLIKCTVEIFNEKTKTTVKRTKTDSDDAIESPSASFNNFSISSTTFDQNQGPKVNDEADNETSDNFVEPNHKSLMNIMNQIDTPVTRAIIKNEESNDENVAILNEVEEDLEKISPMDVDNNGADNQVTSKKLKKITDYFSIVNKKS